MPSGEISEDSPEMIRAKISQSRSMELPVYAHNDALPEEDEEIIKMKIMTQRRNAQQKKDSPAKRRPKAEDIAKSIAQAMKDHEQIVTNGSQSNRSSVISSTVEDEVSTSSFRREHDRSQSSESERVSQGFEFERDHRPPQAAEEAQPQESSAPKEEEGEAQPQESAEVREKSIEEAETTEKVEEVEKAEKAEKKSKSREKGARGKKEKDKEVEAKRAEILAQRDAKLARRRTLDLSTLSETYLTSQEPQAPEQLKLREKKSRDLKDQEKAKLTEKHSSSENPYAGPAVVTPLRRSGSAEVRRRTSKNVKRSKSKRHSTISGSILAEDRVTDIAVVTTRLRDGPEFSEALAPSPEKPAPEPAVVPRKIEIPAAQEVPVAAPPTPKTFKEKLREQFSNSSVKSSTKITHPTTNIVVTSAIESQKFRRTPKSSDGSDDQRRRLSSIISMFETRKAAQPAAEATHEEEGSRSKWSALKRSISTSKKHDESRM